MSVNLWYKSLLIGLRTRISAVVLFKEKNSEYVIGWPEKKKKVHRYRFSEFYGTISNTRMNIQMSNHAIPIEPKNIKCVKSICNERTNQDVVKNARSVWWRLYIFVHVHSSNWRCHIQWVQFVLQHRVVESVSNTARQSYANLFTFRWLCSCSQELHGWCLLK